MTLENTISAATLILTIIAFIYLAIVFFGHTKFNMIICSIITSTYFLCFSLRFFLVTFDEGDLVAVIFTFAISVASVLTAIEEMIQENKNNHSQCANKQ